MGLPPGVNQWVQRDPKCRRQVFCPCGRQRQHPGVLALAATWAKNLAPVLVFPLYQLVDPLGRPPCRGASAAIDTGRAGQFGRRDHILVGCVSCLLACLPAGIHMWPSPPHLQLPTVPAAPACPAGPPPPPPGRHAPPPFPPWSDCRRTRTAASTPTYQRRAAWAKPTTQGRCVLAWAGHKSSQPGVGVAPMVQRGCGFGPAELNLGPSRPKTCTLTHPCCSTHPRLAAQISSLHHGGTRASIR